MEILLNKYYLSAIIFKTQQRMKKNLFLSIVFSLTIVLFFSACKKDDPDAQSDVPTGIVKGQVFAENGTTPLPSVKVFVDFDGEIYITQTNSQGYFLLEAPSGKQIVNFQSGRGTIFRSQIEVDIKENGITDIPGGNLKLTQVAELAYIQGAYDQIQTIIIDSLGYTATEIQIADLANLTTLQLYSAIFLNCGKPGTLDSAMYSNLQTYVEEGGCLYASDFAVEYLTGDNALYNPSPIRHGFVTSSSHQKTCIPRTGGFIDETSLCTSKEGPVMTIAGVDIVAADLQVYLGALTTDIEFDLGGWEVIQVLGSEWEVLLEDNTATGFGPLAVRRALNPSAKQVNDQMEQGWVTICHIPPGNPNNPITITISINALPAHLAHGDYLGACTGTGGQILFTTFHNHPFGHADEDVLKMLEYFIINL